MDFQITTEFRHFLLLEDIWDSKPGNDLYVFIARSLRKKTELSQIPGILRETIITKSFLVPSDKKENILGKVSYGDVTDDTRSYFEDDGNYITGESFEHNGIQLENIYNSRFFEGLDLGYYEPKDRLVLYLNLHRNGNNWINPFSKETIIKAEGTTRGWDPHDTYLSVRKSELKDYLAARKCGVLLLQYSDRTLFTPNQLEGLPEPFYNEITKSGRRSWLIDKWPLCRNKIMYFCQLLESFWINPATSPRRWDAQIQGEFKDGVRFVTDDGETSTYKEDGKDRLSMILSFKPTLFPSFRSLPNHSITFLCLSDLDLRYADGTHLTGCVNKEGQFQTFFGSVAKLDTEKQRYLSGFSEPLKAKPSYEFIRTQIEAEFPETLPFSWTLSNCLQSVNSLWKTKFGETLLLSPTKDQIPFLVQIGPTSLNYYELADIMLELQKATISESEIANIKSQLDYSKSATNLKSYNTMRSIGFTRLFFQVNRQDSQDGESYILKVINELRNCKGHPKDVEETLIKHGIPTSSPRIAFLYIMAEFCNFLSAFKGATESLFATIIAVNIKNVEDPWKQLRISESYFREPF